MTNIKNISMILLAALVLMVPASAQQTVNPSGTCTVESQLITISAQNDQYQCFPDSPGSSSGTWKRLSQLAFRVAYARYSFGTDGGAVSTITPAVNSTIPANALVIGSVINSTTAAASGGSATIAVGTSAGSSTTSIKGATAYTSFSSNAIVAGVPVFTAGSTFKMTAAGSITVTIGTATLTAGVVEVFVFYVVPNA